MNNSNKERKSNIELLRIIMMIVVIAHHYVFNSGVIKLFDYNNIPYKMIFVEIFGCGGKIAINVFLIITGYFMCEARVTPLKWISLFVKYEFYCVVINLTFLLFNYKPLGTVSLIYGVVPFVKNLGTGFDSFIAIYMIMFLIIPFLNKFIKTIQKKELLILIMILVSVFSLYSTFFLQLSSEKIVFIRDNYEGLGWYITVYLIGAYIKKYLPASIDNLRIGFYMTSVSSIVIIASIIIFNHIKEISFYHFVIGSNKFMAIVMAISVFILFKNIRMGNIKFINVISSTTFGVLLIHANSDTMRYFLWNDLIDCPTQYIKGGGILIVKAIVSICAIYIICVLIDLVVTKFIDAIILNKIKKISWINKELYANREGE